MPYDIFLKIGDIAGESRDRLHPESIEIESFSWGLSSTGSPARAGSGSGKVVFKDFTFTKKVSKASPELFLACATGRHFPKAEIFVRRPGTEGEELDYYNIQLQDCIVSSYSQDADATAEGTRPDDQFSLIFSRIELEYRAQNDDGSLDSPVKAGYDLKANKKV